MVSMVISFEGKVLIPQHQSFSPAPAAAAGLRSTACVRSTMPVRTVACGRLFRTRATTTRGGSTSIRVTTPRATFTASTDGLFGLSKGSPNSERDAPVAKRSGWVSTKYELRSSRKTPRERIQFFNSSILVEL